MKKILAILACSFLIGNCGAGENKASASICPEKKLAVVCKNLPKKNKERSALTPTQYTLLQSKDPGVRSKLINWLSDGDAKRKKIVSSEKWLESYIAMHKKTVAELRKQPLTDSLSSGNDYYLLGAIFTLAENIKDCRQSSQLPS